ncbi:hypothetical protein M407DRAFT_34105 [Tulasnella calospora MUT 4182]|uniref:Uncharacterized protein n=1 Tax=Tulasnella calospora MUT 4182 TaxID=1051891 RepID=A0A0C3PP55_9AGAM|nr:hypothetical protein M407DRAFT_34105 [Tulasnella calospora MUT 4182]
MAKSVTRNVDQSRRLLQECFYSSKGMKERALKLLELAESQQECLLPMRDRLEVCSIFSCSKGPDWHKADSQIKEWYEFGVLLESVYNIAVTADKMCFDLDAVMNNWMRNFNNTRGLSYDLESDSFIGQLRHPREILNTLEDTILTLE